MLRCAIQHNRRKALGDRTVLGAFGFCLMHTVERYTSKTPKASLPHICTWYSECVFAVDIWRRTFALSWIIFIRVDICRTHLSAENFATFPFLTYHMWMRFFEKFDQFFCLKKSSHFFDYCTLPSAVFFSLVGPYLHKFMYFVFRSHM